MKVRLSHVMKVRLSHVMIQKLKWITSRCHDDVCAMCLHYPHIIPICKNIKIVSVHADATIPERLFAASARTRWLSQGLHAKFNNAYCRCMPFLFSNSVTEPSTQKTKKITSYDPFNNNN